MQPIQYNSHYHLLANVFLACESSRGIGLPPYLTPITSERGRLRARLSSSLTSLSPYRLLFTQPAPLMMPQAVTSMHFLSNSYESPISADN